MRSRILLAVAAALIFLGAGCSLSQSKPKPVAEDPNTDANIEALKDATTRIHQELVKLTRSQQQKNQKAIQQAKTYSTPSQGPLSKLITLTWSGPVDKLVAKLAQEAGYSFPTPLGQPMFRDTFIQVDVIDTPLFKVMEEVGWQAGDRIYVILDDDAKTLSLAYKGD